LEHDVLSSSNPAWLTLMALASLLEQREVSSREITELMLRRIDQFDGTLNGYMTVLADRALADAAAADRKRATGETGPLLGIPLAIKDLCDMRGVPTTAGSRILAGVAAEQDATVVGLLQDAGAVLLGKTHMAEFAYGFAHPDYGPSRTPWDTTRSASGSSGGSGAVVAAGLAYAAIGSDTAGSIRFPAAACGITGHKPTYGLVSKAGVVPFSWTFDHVGPMTRSARDARLLLEVIAGHDARDPASVEGRNRPRIGRLHDLRGRRFGVDRRLCDKLHPEVERAFEATLTTLRDLGAEIHDVQIVDLELVNAMAFSIMMPEVVSFHTRWLRERPEDYTPAVRTAFEGALAIPAAQYVDAQRLRSRFNHDFQAVFTDHGLDALVWPPVSGLPASVVRDPGTDSYVEWDMRRTVIANLTGAPSVTIPCGFTSDNLPLSVLLTGLPYQDDRVLRIAEVYQSVTDWHERHPTDYDDTTAGSSVSIAPHTMT
jgi:aspartyl-tRNA(Asn)/glutamyl-tRNA(Gln) amidotransferase subunit A